MSANAAFWDSMYVWRDAVIVAVLSAAALSWLGVWIVLKRVVYVPLALSQASSAGVVAAFLIADLADSAGVAQQGYEILDPALAGLVFAGLASVYFASAAGRGGQATVVAYLLSATAVLILGGFIRHDLHDVSSLLFGNAVLVETVQIVWVGGAAAVVAGIHLLLYRRFLFVSYDPDAAGAAGLSVRRYEIVLYLTFALMISVATRAMGALPAFGFTVFPPLIGVTNARSMAGAAAISLLSGVFSAAAGYYLSFILELPTGACMVGVAGVLYLVSAALSRQK